VKGFEGDARTPSTRHRIENDNGKKKGWKEGRKKKKRSPSLGKSEAATFFIDFLRER